MAFHNSGRIVTSGLVLSLDAADSNSYVSGSTTWFDLSGNNNTGSLVNGPTFSSANGGAIVFDGVNDYVTSSFNSQLGDFTAIAWFKSAPTQSGKTYDRILEKNYLTGFWMGRNQGIPNQWGGGIKNLSSPTFGIFVTLQDQSWHFIASIRSGSTHIIYGDGINNKATTSCTSSLLDSTALGIGSDYTNGYLSGSIASVQIYNRALSETEILQNYNQLKSRFNL